MFMRILQFSISQQFSHIQNRNVFITAQNLKSLKKKKDYSKVPEVKDEDLSIQYVRGSGPGGQATNKTNNCVVIKHIATGIVVKCHETRSQLKNQEKAMEILITKLDNHFNGEQSVENQEKRIMKQISLKREAKRKKLAALKAAFKEREGLE